MSQVTYRANLSAKAFPFLSQNWGRTVIVPQYDNTFSRQLTSQEDPDKDVGLPQIYYCHNVMPHSQGFQSVGYNTIFSGSQSSGSGGGPSDQELGTIYPFYGNGVNNFCYISQAFGGDIWIYEGSSWTNKATTGGFGGFGTLSVATVSGTSYAFFSPFCETYNFSTHAFVNVTLTGLTMATIRGITDAFGYMIAWDDSTIYWSSTIDPTDFTPSLVTGAGSQSVEQAKGKIVACVHHALGFFIYTSQNIIAALYTGNSRFPFTFREIVGSGGVSSDSLITHDANTTNHYAYTTSGLQQISSSATQTISPELTDFLSGRVFEDYDETTDTFFVFSALANPMPKAVALISDRYLIISYAKDSSVPLYTHALVYDLISQRHGKLKITHTRCFEYSLPNSAVVEAPKQSIAFLQADGSIQLLSFSPYDTTSYGVLMLGKYQFVRPRLLQLDEVNIENVEQTANFTIYDLAAIDGKNGVRSDLSVLESSGQYRKYGSRAVGVNHSLVCRGRFFLTSLVLSFNIHGKR